MSIINRIRRRKDEENILTKQKKRDEQTDRITDIEIDRRRTKRKGKQEKK